MALFSDNVGYHDASLARHSRSSQHRVSNKGTEASSRAARELEAGEVSFRLKQSVCRSPLSTSVMTLPDAVIQLAPAASVQ